MFHTPPKGRTRNFHTNTITPPLTRPVSAPGRVVRFQNRQHSISGPNAPPKPAHAKLTIWNTLELGSCASRMATIEIPRIVARATSRLCLVLSLMCRKSCTRFWLTLELAASSWLSAVDMVAARMPARIKPATMLNKTPFWLIKCVICTMMVSLSPLLASRGTRPALVMALPTMPINTATAMEITTHTLAIRRLSLSLSSSSMAIKRSRIWGMPK